MVKNAERQAALESDTSERSVASSHAKIGGDARLTMEYAMDQLQARDETPATTTASGERWGEVAGSVRDGS